jgi:hypothetical protein
MKNKSINESNLKTPPLGSDSSKKPKPFREKSKIYRLWREGKKLNILYQNLIKLIADKSQKGFFKTGKNA